ncbi:MAB_1171c family putative transporter [Amycolatopsis aidingensis]|uniref:MAB_1171c family putative transporter n=1 Tax=Amycolatopsis aidingensis TaxID=2842453 RepID=UPI001C0C9B0C|nr:MAB_1171c family putative transporter [Amycolatopsis aidingensis]
MSWLIDDVLIVCLVAALIWKGYQLARQPANLPLQAIVAFLAFALLGQVLRAITENATLSQGGPVWAAVAWYVPISAACVSLLFFFDAATLARAEAARRTRRNALALTLEIAVLVGTAAAAPKAISQQHTSVIYVTANLFMGVIFVACTRSALRYARQGERRLAWGLRLAAAGFAVMATSLAVFLVVDFVYWFTGSVPMTLAIPTGYVAVLALVAITIGLLYPAARMRLTAIRVWWRHRRAVQDLDPLWTILHKEFPEDALSRVPRKPWDVIGLVGVHRRYYRRVIECRDGLVRISPYIAQLRQNHREDKPVADLLREALRAHAANQPAPSHAVPIAIPTTTGVDADVHELIMLSRTLARAEGIPAGGTA